MGRSLEEGRAGEQFRLMAITRGVSRVGESNLSALPKTPKERISACRLGVKLKRDWLRSVRLRGLERTIFEKSILRGILAHLPL
jgi:hypothetical protein